jgi:hypothetical protein
MKLKTLISLLPVLLIAFTGVVQAAPKADKKEKVEKVEKDKKPKLLKHQIAFAQADDGDGFLTIFEFAKTQGRGTPLVEIRSRFIPIDTSGAFEVVLDPVTGAPAVDLVTGVPIVGASIPDGLVSLAEWDAYVEGKKKEKSDLTRFELADFDGDGQLDPIEFGYLVSPMVKMDNTIRKFEETDISDDGFITEDEFVDTDSPEV